MLKPGDKIVLLNEVVLSKSILDFKGGSVWDEFPDLMEKTKILRSGDKLRLVKMFQKFIRLSLFDGPTFEIATEAYINMRKESLEYTIRSIKEQLNSLDLDLDVRNRIEADLLWLEQSRLEPEEKVNWTVDIAYDIFEKISFELI